MAAYALVNFHEAMRALLGDEGDPASGYDYVAEQLDGALRTVVRMGFLPCLTIAPDSGYLTDAPVNPDTWGYLVARAALLMLGGAAPINIRTRAISVSSDAGARRDSLAAVEAMVCEIDARGNVCGAAGDTGHKGLFSSVGDVVTYCALGHCGPPPPCCP